MTGAWSEFDATYVSYFDGRLPPRVTVEVASLALGGIEISMVAHVRDESDRHELDRWRPGDVARVLSFKR